MELTKDVLKKIYGFAKIQSKKELKDYIEKLAPSSIELYDLRYQFTNQYIDKLDSAQLVAAWDVIDRLYSRTKYKEEIGVNKTSNIKKKTKKKKE